MPVVHVRSLDPPGGAPQVDAALAAVARAVAAVVEDEPSGTWCTFTALDRMTIGDQPVVDAGRVVYLDVWMRSRTPELERAALVAAAGAAAEGLGVPLEDVWATLRPVEDGRAFAGGAIVEG